MEEERRRESMSESELNRLLLSIAVDYGGDADPPYASTSSSPPIAPHSLPHGYSSLSTDDLRRVPSDLHNYRRRIDAGVEEQRRQREILEALQLKLLKCRQQRAANESTATHQPRAHCPTVPNVAYLNLISTSDEEAEWGCKRRTARRRMRRKLRRSNSQEDIAMAGTAAADESSALRLQLKEEQNRSALLDEMVLSLRHQLATSERINADLVHLAKALQLGSEPTGHGWRQQEPTPPENRTLEQLRPKLYGLWLRASALRNKFTNLESDVRTDLNRQSDALQHAEEIIKRTVKRRIDELNSRHATDADYQRQAFEELARRLDEMAAGKAQVEHQLDEVSRRERNLTHTIQTHHTQLIEHLERIRRMPEAVGADAAHSSLPTTTSFPMTHDAALAELVSTVATALRDRSARLREADTRQRSLEGECERLKRVAEHSERELSNAKMELERERSAMRRKELELHTAKSDCARLRDKVDRTNAEVISTQQELALARHRLASDEERRLREADDVSRRAHSEWGAKLAEAVKAAREECEFEQRVELKRNLHETEQLRLELDTRMAEVRRLEADLSRAGQASRRDEMAASRLVEETRVEKARLSEELTRVNASNRELERELGAAKGRLVSLAAHTKQLISTRKGGDGTEQQSSEEDEKEKLATLETENTRLRGRLAETETSFTRIGPLEEEQAALRSRLVSADELNERQRQAIDGMEGKLERANGQSAALRVKLAECEEHTRMLTAAVDAAKRENDALSNELERVKTSDRRAMRQLEAQLEELRGKLHDLNGELGRLTVADQKKVYRLKETELEISLLRERTSELESRLEAERSAHRDELERATKLTELNIGERCERLQKDLERMSVEKEHVEREFADLKVHHTELNDEHRRMHDGLETTRDTLERLSDERAALAKSLAAQTDAHQDDFREWSAEREQLTDRHREQLGHVAGALERSEAAVREAREREETLNARLGDAEMRLEEATETTRGLRLQLEAAEQSGTESQSRVERERKALLAEVGELKDSREHLHRRLDEEQRRASRLEADYEAARQAEEKFRLQLQAAKASHTAASAELMKWKERETEWRTQLGIMQGEVAELRSKMLGERAVGSCKNCTQMTNENAALVADAERLRRETKAKTAVMADRMAAALKHAEREEFGRVEASRKLDALREEHASCAGQLSRCRSEVARLEEALMRERTQHEGVLAANNRLNVETLELRMEIQRLEEEMRGTQLEIARLRREQTPQQPSQPSGTHRIFIDPEADDVDSRTSTSQANGEDGEELETEGHLTITSHGRRWVINKRTLSIVDGGGGHNERVSQTLKLELNSMKHKLVELQTQNEVRSAELMRLRMELERCTNDGIELRERNRRLEWEWTQATKERDSLDNQLASCRQLLVSQEETVNAQESDKKALKAKLLSCEMHLRERESLARGLQEKLSAVREELLEIDGLRRDASLARQDRDELHRTSDCSVAVATRSLEELRQRYELAITEKEEAITELHKANSRLADSSRRIAELEKTVTGQQSSIDHLQHDELQWRSRTVSVKQSACVDAKQLEQRLESTKIALNTATIRCRDLEREKEGMRRELLDVRSRLSSSTLRVDSLLAQVADLETERKRLAERADVLERSDRVACAANKQRDYIVDALQRDRLSLVAELDALKERLATTSSVERELRSLISRMERERAAYKQHVEALELDKQRIEAVVRQTTLERHALEKSVKAMEKENSELYRQCDQLQASVAQLERENAERTNLVLEGRRRSQLEAELRRLSREKSQLERVLNQREHNYESKQRAAQLQVVSLREQLDRERRRRGQSVRTSQVEVVTQELHHSGPLRRANSERRLTTGR